MSTQALPHLAPPPLALFERAALFLDFDGTLVPIAPTPDAVAVDAALIDLLGRLRARLDGRLALLSGRSLADLGALLADWDGLAAGSHGLEPSDEDAAVRQRDVAALLADELAALRAMLAEAPADEPRLRAKIQRRTRAYLRSLALAWELAGEIQRLPCDLWGIRPASTKQRRVIAFIGRGMMRKTQIPMPHRRALQAVLDDVARLTTAEASDLIAILDAARQRSPWPATTIFEETP